MVAPFVGGMAAAVVGVEAQAAFNLDISLVVGAVPVDASSFQPQPSVCNTLGGMAAGEVASLASGGAFDRLLQEGGPSRSDPEIG